MFDKDFQIGAAPEVEIKDKESGEIFSLTALIQAIIDFINKLIKFEF